MANGIQYSQTNVVPKVHNVVYLNPRMQKRNYCTGKPKAFKIKANSLIDENT